MVVKSLRVCVCIIFAVVWQLSGQCLPNIITPFDCLAVNVFFLTFELNRFQLFSMGVIQLDTICSTTLCKGICAGGCTRYALFTLCAASIFICVRWQ